MRDANLKNSLLELIDLNQNKNCYDNFIDINFYLSKSLFISSGREESFIDPIHFHRLKEINIPNYSAEEMQKIDIKINQLKKYYCSIISKIFNQCSTN